MIKLKDKLIYETLKLVESQGEDGFCAAISKAMRSL